MFSVSFDFAWVLLRVDQLSSRNCYQKKYIDPTRENLNEGMGLLTVQAISSCSAFFGTPLRLSGYLSGAVIRTKIDN